MHSEQPRSVIGKRTTHIQVTSRILKISSSVLEAMHSPSVTFSLLRFLSRKTLR